MSYIQTFSGKKFDVLEANPEQIHILDISKALSQTNRFGGHTTTTYSVAEHSVRVADALWDEFHDVRLSRQGLLHDAAEAYLGDIVKPLKDQIPLFEELENKLLAVILGKYGCEPVLDDRVKVMDRRALAMESSLLLRPSDEVDWESLMKGVTPISWRRVGFQNIGWEPERARIEFEHAFVMYQ